MKSAVANQKMLVRFNVSGVLLKNGLLLVWWQDWKPWCFLNVCIWCNMEYWFVVDMLASLVVMVLYIVSGVIWNIGL